MSVLVGCALDGILGRGLRNSAIRPESCPEVDDVSAADVVDKPYPGKSEKGREIRMNLSGTIDVTYRRRKQV